MPGGLTSHHDVLQFQNLLPYVYISKFFFSQRFNICEFVIIKLILYFEKKNQISGVDHVYYEYNFNGTNLTSAHPSRWYILL